MKAIISIVALVTANNDFVQESNETETFKLRAFEWEYTSDLGSGEEFPLSFDQYFGVDCGVSYGFPSGKDLNSEQNLSFVGEITLFAGGVQWMEFDSDYLSIYAELQFYPLWWNLLDHSVIWNYPKRDDSVCMTTVSELLLGWMNVNVEVGFYKCAWSFWTASVEDHKWYTCDWSYSSFDDLVDYTLWTLEPTLFDTCTADVTEEPPVVTEETVVLE